MPLDFADPLSRDLKRVLTRFKVPVSICFSIQLNQIRFYCLFHNLVNLFANRFSADEKFDGTYPTNVVVRSNGSCNYIPPGIFKSTCKIDITWFPFDDQMCELKFGSWTYAGLQLDLRLNSEEGGDLSSYIQNGEWDLLGK